eukprot:UN00784
MFAARPYMLSITTERLLPTHDVDDVRLHTCKTTTCSCSRPSLEKVFPILLYVHIQNHLINFQYKMANGSKDITTNFSV